MRHGVVSALLVLAVTLFSGAQAGEGYRVSKIRAHLYFHETGEIGAADLINGKDVALWNTIIGEGMAGTPSTAIWVVVELGGPGFTSEVKGKLVVTATAKQPKGSKVLAKQTFELSSYFSEGNAIQVPLLVYGTGCAVVEIAASLRGVNPKGATTELKKEIPFACGE
jgi:hypothetical protein